jgi:hypothetical protein
LIRVIESHETLVEECRGRASRRLLAGHGFHRVDDRRTRSTVVSWSVDRMTFGHRRRRPSVGTDLPDLVKGQHGGDAAAASDDDAPAPSSQNNVLDQPIDRGVPAQSSQSFDMTSAVTLCWSASAT